jgi:hydroxymethylglutaryl-CoA reductase
MTAPGYSPGDYGKAEQLAAEARSYLGQEDGKDTAAVLAAVAQVHATLAVAEAISGCLRGALSRAARQPVLLQARL